MAKSRRRVVLKYQLQRELEDQEVRTVQASVDTFRAKGRQASASIEVPASNDDEARELGLGRMNAAFDAASIGRGDQQLESARVDPT